MIFFVYLSILVLSCILYIYYIKKGKNIFPLPPILTLAPTPSPTLPKPNNLISVVNVLISTSDDFYVSNSGHKITYDLIQTIKLSNPELIKNKTFSELEMIIQSNISEQHKNILNVLIDMLKKVASIFGVSPSIIKVNDISRGSIRLNLEFLSELDNPMEAIESVEKILINKNDLGNKTNIISNGFNPNSINLISKKTIIYTEKIISIPPTHNKSSNVNLVTNKNWSPPLWWEINMEKLKKFN